jgi:hypothetical protein
MFESRSCHVLFAVDKVAVGGVSQVFSLLFIISQIASHLLIILISPLYSLEADSIVK